MAQVAPEAPNDLLKVLHRPDAAYFESLSPQDRGNAISDLQKSFAAIISNFHSQAQQRDREFIQIFRNLRRWRMRLATLSAGLAIFNLLVSSWASLAKPEILPASVSFLGSPYAASVLSFVAALYAAVLVGLQQQSQLESSWTDAQNVREARDFLASAYMSLDAKWRVYVTANQHSASAGQNASVLVELAAAEDTRSRTLFRPANTSDKSTPAKIPANRHPPTLPANQHKCSSHAIRRSPAFIVDRFRFPACPTGPGSRRCHHFQ
jgi:hypothetical protein